MWILWMKTGRLMKASPLTTVALPVHVAAPVAGSTDTAPGVSKLTAGVVPVPGIGVNRR
jgi:hypothetical protein